MTGSHKRHLIPRLARRVLFALGYGLAGSFVLGLVLYVHFLLGRPDLDPWHTVELKEEFHARLATDKIKTLADYTRLEQRLFDELREKLYDKAAPADSSALLRFSSGSAADPQSYPANWNRPYEQSHDAVARRVAPRSSTPSSEPLNLEWPKDTYSLTHVALPFSPDDPLYGYSPVAGSTGLHLGRLALRGEKGVLIVSAGEQLRLRANPFFPYLEKRMLAHFQLARF